MGESWRQRLLVLLVTVIVASWGVGAAAAPRPAAAPTSAAGADAIADTTGVPVGAVDRGATSSGVEGDAGTAAQGADRAAVDDENASGEGQVDDENRSFMTYGESEGEPVDGFDRQVEKEHPVAIPFKSGPVRLEEGLDPVLTDTNRDEVYAVVQFRAEPSDALLDEYGYREVGPLTYLATFARLPTEALGAFAEREVVRSVASIEPQWKLSPWLTDRPSTVTVLTFEPVDGLAEYGLERVGENEYRGELSREEARELARLHEVKWIEPYNEPEVGVAQGRRIVNAEDVSTQFTGSGIRVGVIDTGIAHSHPHFSSTTIVDSRDTRDNDWFPEADNWNFSKNWHGVHVAGTIAGQSTFRGTEVEGVAPQATLVPARGLWTGNYGNVAGNGSDIISNSWGANTTGMYRSRSRTTDQWARNNRNTLLVFCYGNSGQMGPDVWGPGLAKNVLTVGAVTDGSNGRRVDAASIKNANQVSGLNNLAQPKDGRTKPDVLGPGTNIFAPITNGSYGSAGGCSMATPHVSGVAALVEDAYRSRGTDLRANQAKVLLAATTGPVDNPRNLPKGHGLVDAENAIYEDDYEYVQKPFTGTVKTDETVEHQFFVQSGTEEVVVALSWLDPAASTNTNDTLTHDLDMYVGPEDDPRRYRITDTTENLLKLDVDDPETGQWVVTVDGYEVPNGPQRYDGVVRTVAYEPKFFVHTDPNVRVNYWEGDNATMNVTLIGQGAPVTGTWATVEAQSTSLYRRCGDDGTLAGTVSRGERERRMHCFEVPRSTANYTVKVTAGGTNAVGGTRSETVTLEVVTDRVEPNSSRPQGYIQGTTVSTLRIEATDEIQTPHYDPSGVADVRWQLVDRSVVPSGANTSGGARRTVGDTWELQGLPSGNYTVEYWAVDAAGNREYPSKTVDVEVDGTPPEAVAEIEDRPVILGVTGDTANETQFNNVTIVPVDEQVTFTGSASSDDSGSIGRYDWTFGDGTGAAGENVTHTYANTGYQTITLTVDDGVGNTNSTELTVYVAPKNETVLQGDQEVSVSTSTPLNVTVPTATFGDGQLDDLEVTPRTAGVGETVAVAADLTNAGTASSSFVVGLLVDGQVVDRTGVTVDGGDTQPVALPHTFSATGTYQVTLALLDTDDNVQSALPMVDVTVTQTSGSTPTTSQPATPTSTPGFGVAVALVALAVVALRRRRG